MCPWKKEKMEEFQTLCKQKNEWGLNENDAQRYHDLCIFLKNEKMLPENGLEDLEVYSYHTFMLPFLWKGEHNSIKTQKEFIEFLENPDEGYWKPYQCPLFEDEIGPEDSKKYDKIYEESKLNYAIFQYYNTPARKAIYGLKGTERTIDLVDLEADVRNYVLDCESLAKDNNGKIEYKIEVTLSDDKTYTYSLDINNITLRLYPVGIAILVYELENRLYPCLEIVKNINDYGRRVQLACMDPTIGFKLTADKLTVCGIEENFTQIISGYKKNYSRLEENPWKKDKDNNYISNTVMKLFQDKNNKMRISTRFEEGKLYIEPYVDDRMFVQCLVSDGTLIPYQSVSYENVQSIEQGVLAWKLQSLNTLKRRMKTCTKTEREQLEKEKHYIELRNHLTLESLYEFVYVDPSHNNSCQNREFLKNQLESSLYARWIEYGTLQGVTPYSMVCITGSHEKVSANVINPFLTIYKELVQIVLVQRAAIIMFAESAAFLAHDSYREKNGVGEEILKLQKEYVSFQNQFLLFEVTAQIQGIELYTMLQEKMEIRNQEQEIEKQLQNLYEISQTELGDKTNKTLNIMTVFGLLFTGGQIIQQQFVDRCNIHGIDFTFYTFGLFVIIFSIIQNNQLDGKKDREIVWLIIGGFIIAFVTIMIWTLMNPKI